MGAMGITIAGWWAWNGFLSGVYTPQFTPYPARDAFAHTFGPDPLWWLTLIIVVLVLISMELVYKVVKRNLIVAGMWRWPPWKRRSLDDSLEKWGLEVWQELEQDPVIRERLRRACMEDGELDDEEHDSIDPDDVAKAL